MQPLRGEKGGRKEGGGGERWDRGRRGTKGRESETVGDRETGLRPDWARTCKTTDITSRITQFQGEVSVRY